MAIAYRSWQRPEHVAAMERLLGLENPPTAVLAANDLSAIGALHAALRKVLNVPEDISVIGFDDIDEKHFKCGCQPLRGLNFAPFLNIQVHLDISMDGGHRGSAMTETAMDNRKSGMEEDLLVENRKLRRENRELKQLFGNLSDELDKLRRIDIVPLYTLEGNRYGVWDWNCSTDEVILSKGWKEMLGYGEDEIADRLSEWEKHVHPDDRENHTAGLHRLVRGEILHYENEYRLRCKDGTYKWILVRGRTIAWCGDGKPTRIIGTHRDVSLEREMEIENQRLIIELGVAINKVKTLGGLLPICAKCKKIRDDKGYWNQIENYIRDHSEAEFSHSICPECIKELYPGIRTSGK